MFIAGHVGLGLGAFCAGRWAAGVRERVNLWWVAFFALLPDLIDKPVGFIWWELGSRRLFAHSLLFAVLTLVVVRLLWPRLTAYAWLVPVHLALDSMWLSRYTLYFPFRGWRFDPDPLPPYDLASFLKLIIWKITHQPEMLWGEVLGLAVLGVALAIRLRRPREAPSPVSPSTP